FHFLHFLLVTTNLTTASHRDYSPLTGSLHVNVHPHFPRTQYHRPLFYRPQLANTQLPYPQHTHPQSNLLPSNFNYSPISSATGSIYLLTTVELRLFTFHLQAGFFVFL
ncbi:unnamed protein product, partial [Brassica oleracea var. botrytis]